MSFALKTLWVFMHLVYFDLFGCEMNWGGSFSFCLNGFGEDAMWVFVVCLFFPVLLLNFGSWNVPVLS